MTVFSRVAGIRNPLVRNNLFAVLLIYEAPCYFWGAWRHDRLDKLEFWAFTRDIVLSVFQGHWVMK